MHLRDRLIGKKFKSFSTTEFNQLNLDFADGSGFGIYTDTVVTWKADEQRIAVSDFVEASDTFTIIFDNGSKIAISRVPISPSPEIFQFHDIDGTVVVEN
ncbi:hypothetical protein [Phyllobacterium sp. YR531]|uniref:hypothetical protein n=1 Tax=Phyllobacterium sp. YR531 TaxID=1144343 RepID=UPI00026FA9D0|nr:hypothetical protein [Phyllobacterium sp. YR531]EJN04182.1 hypothetical protein PMI41_01821 [Phyllobacterium sp. YR531]